MKEEMIEVEWKEGLFHRKTYRAKIPMKEYVAQKRLDKEIDLAFTLLPFVIFVSPFLWLWDKLKGKHERKKP